MHKDTTSDSTATATTIDGGDLFHMLKGRMIDKMPCEEQARLLRGMEPTEREAVGRFLSLPPSVILRVAEMPLEETKSLPAFDCAAFDGDLSAGMINAYIVELTKLRGRTAPRRTPAERILHDWAGASVDMLGRNHPDNGCEEGDVLYAMGCIVEWRDKAIEAVKASVAA